MAYSPLALGRMLRQYRRPDRQGSVAGASVPADRLPPPPPARSPPPAPVSAPPPSLSAPALVPSGTAMVTANPLLIPELRLMLAEDDASGLREVAAELHPASVAEFSEGLEDREIWQLLGAVPVERQAAIFPYYPIARQVRLIEAVDHQRLGPLIEAMAADNRADLLRELDAEKVEEILPLVAKAERHDIRMLLSCPEDSAGALMTTEYASLPAHITAGEAVARLRTQAPATESIYYIYVLEADRRLVGIVSLRALILARPTALVSDLMQRDPIRVRVGEPRDEVVRKLARFDFLAIPVVDDQDRLVGIITHDDVHDRRHEGIAHQRRVEPGRAEG